MTKGQALSRLRSLLSRDNLIYTIRVNHGRRDVTPRYAILAVDNGVIADISSLVAAALGAKWNNKDGGIPNTMGGMSVLVGELSGLLYDGRYDVLSHVAL